MQIHFLDITNATERINKWHLNLNLSKSVHALSYTDLKNLELNIAKIKTLLILCQ